MLCSGRKWGRLRMARRAQQRRSGGRSRERIAAANLTPFMAEAGALGRRRRDLPRSLWLVDRRSPSSSGSRSGPSAGVIGDTQGETVLSRSATACRARSSFPQARLNYAENLLRRRDDGDAMVFWGEDKVKRRMTWRRALRPGVAAGAGAEERWASSPATASPASCRTCRRPWWRRWPPPHRRHLVVLLARFRRPRRDRPLRPDRPARAVHRRRLLLQRQGP